MGVKNISTMVATTTPGWVGRSLLRSTADGYFGATTNAGTALWEFRQRAAGTGAVPATYLTFPTSHNSGAPFCIGVNSTYGTPTKEAETDATMILGFNVDPLSNKIVSSTGLTAGRVQYLMMEHNYVSSSGDLTSMLDELHYECEDKNGNVVRVWHENFAPDTGGFTHLRKGSWQLYPINSGQTFTGNPLILDPSYIKMPKNSALQGVLQDNATTANLICFNADDRIQFQRDIDVGTYRIRFDATNGRLGIAPNTFTNPPQYPLDVASSNSANSSATGYIAATISGSTSGTFYGLRSYMQQSGSAGNSGSTIVSVFGQTDISSSVKPSAATAFLGQINNSSGGTVGTARSYHSNPSCTGASSVITNYYHHDVADVFTNGGASVGTQTAFHVPSTFSGGSTNYAFRSESTTALSQFCGGLWSGSAALATNATTGFLGIPSCAGTPTGVPASIPTGQIPLVYDSTNHKIYAYSGSWRSVTLA